MPPGHDRHRYSSNGEQARIAIAKLGNRAGLLGAAALAFRFNDDSYLTEIERIVLK